MNPASPNQVSTPVTIKYFKAFLIFAFLGFWLIGPTAGMLTMFLTSLTLQSVSAAIGDPTMVEGIGYRVTLALFGALAWYAATFPVFRWVIQRFILKQIRGLT